jgi:hypothetical protein
VVEIRDYDDRIVEGWATVEVIDMQGEVIPIDLIKQAMLKYMDMGGPLVLAHSNKQIGKILQWEIRKHPATGTDALWIVAKIDKIYPTHDEVWEMIKRGEFKGFSVGGRGKRKLLKLKPEFRDKGLPEEVKVIDNLELFEISLAPTPANPYATIEAVSMAKMYEEKKKLTYEEILQKYRVSEGELAVSDGCILCRFVKKVYEDCGDLETAVRVGFVLYQREVTKRSRVEELYKKVVEGIQTVESVLDYPKKGPELEREKEIKEKLKSIMEQVEGYVAKIAGEISKPFAAWGSFDECVSDMKSQGYSEDSAKRICGSLQAKYEKADVRKWHQFAEEAISHIDMAIEVLEQAGSEGLGDVIEALEDACDTLYDMVIEEVGEEGIDEEGETVDDTVMESIKNIVKDKRPPKKWFDRCVEETGRPALCGWVYYHHLKPYKPRSKREPDKPHTEEARERKRKYGL